MRDIKVGVIGCGLFGSTIIEGFKGVPFARVEAICDTNPRTLSAAAKRYKIKKAFKDFTELCRLPELDAVCVVTPEDKHRAPVIAAFENGKHVYCEKPIATSIADAEAMIAKAEKMGLEFMIGHILRFETRYVMAKEEIDAGKVGKIIAISARRNRLKDQYALYSRTHFAIETSIHDIDTMLWYTKDKVVNVRGFMRQVQKGPNPDVVLGIMEFAGGCIANLETMILIPKQAGVVIDDAMKVVGDKGFLNLDIAPAGLYLWGNNGYQSYDIGYDSRFYGQANGAMLAELTYFATCISEGKKVKIINPYEALDSLKVALALVQSGKTEKDVKLT